MLGTKLFIAKLGNLKKENNSVIKEGRVMDHVQCNSPQCPLLVYEVSWDMLLTKNQQRGNTL